MKKFLLLPILVLASQAGAQMSTTPKVVLLMLEQVRAELKVRPDQAKKLDNALDAMVQTLPSGVRGISMQPEQMPGIEKEVLKILDPSQQTRLRQIWMQMEGGLTLTDDGISKELSLTAEQKAQLEGLVGDMKSEIEELASNSAGGPMDSNYVRKRTAEKMLSLLNSDQKKKWDSLLGPKFEFKAPAAAKPLVL